MTQDDRCFHQPQGLVYNHLECLYKNTINKPLHLPNLRFWSQKKNVRHRFSWFWVSTSPWCNRLLAATIFSTSRPDGVNTSLSAVPVQKATQLNHSDHESNWIISACQKIQLHHNASYTICRLAYDVYDLLQIYSRSKSSRVIFRKHSPKHRTRAQKFQS